MDPMAASSSSDQRNAVRFDTSMPVQIDGTAGHIQNISAHGVYFETDVQQRVGALVNFTVEFTLYGRKHTLLCEGKVIRVDQHGDRVGVAARLVAPFFDGAEQADPAAVLRVGQTAG
ncbi:MAG: hypothetical protein JWP41_2406 [Ramlibacter sp.]|jgi:hypothetical protein|nr:hypothetical protein [Ramlibacter sp.]